MVSDATGEREPVLLVPALSGSSGSARRMRRGRERMKMMGS